MSALAFITLSGSTFSFPALLIALFKSLKISLYAFFWASPAFVCSSCFCCGFFLFFFAHPDAPNPNNASIATISVIKIPLTAFFIFSSYFSYLYYCIPFFAFILSLSSLNTHAPITIRNPIAPTIYTFLLTAVRFITPSNCALELSHEAS